MRPPEGSDLQTVLLLWKTLGTALVGRGTALVGRGIAVMGRGTALVGGTQPSWGGAQPLWEEDTALMGRGHREGHSPHGEGEGAKSQTNKQIK